MVSCVPVEYSCNASHRSSRSFSTSVRLKERSRERTSASESTVRDILMGTPTRGSTKDPEQGRKIDGGLTTLDGCWRWVLEERREEEQEKRPGSLPTDERNRTEDDIVLVSKESARPAMSNHVWGGGDGRDSL